MEECRVFCSPFGYWILNGNGKKNNNNSYNNLFAFIFKQKLNFDLMYEYVKKNYYYNHNINVLQTLYVQNKKRWIKKYIE